MHTPHHLIVGAGIAGVSAAIAMRDRGFDGRITLVDSECHAPYERPPLSKTNSALRPLLQPETYVDKRIDLRLGTRVIGLDVDRHRVLFDDGDDAAADQVLLTTGVAPRRLGAPGEGLDGVLTLRTADDAAQVFAGLDRGGPLVVVGGGFIGLEAAAVAVERGIEVSLIETGNLPLSRPLGPALAELVTQLHRQLGVQVYTEATAAEFLGKGRVERVRLSTGVMLSADTVIVGCGVVPNEALAGNSGVYCNGGIVADRTGRTSNPWLWTAGDVACQPHPHAAQRERIEHWDVARRHGTAVGASMVGVPTENTEAPYFWSDQYGLTLQMFGRGRQGDRIVVRDGSTPEKFLAFWLRNGLVAAVAGMDEPKAVRAGKKLVEVSAFVDPAILKDRDLDVRALAKKVGQATVTS